MGKKSIREKQRARRRRENLKVYAIAGVISIAVLAILWALIAPSLRPTLGEAAPELPADHVVVGSDPGPYNTDPPTSGPHYGSELDAGFYDQSDLNEIGPYPEGYLLHNLEHGYVILWYNCDLLDADECGELKDQIQEVLRRNRNNKVIGFPRNSIEFPVVMTSWTRILEFDEFDTDLANQFVRNNRNKAPEPNAP
jgi:hypothetical protein